MMDYELLREKVELLIKGLECMVDGEAEEEFIALLDSFTERMMNRCNRKLAEQASQVN